MFRRALSFILAASVFSAPLAHAATATAPSFTRATDPLSMKGAVRSAVVSKPAEFAVGVGHGLLFVMTIAGIDLLIQEIRKEGLNSQSLSPSKLYEIASKVAIEVVNSGQTLTALVSATVFASVSQKPAEILTKMLVDPASKKMLASMIASSIVSTVGFLSWEFGAQLWTNASLMIEDKADYQRLTQAFGVGTGSFRALLHLNPTAADANDLRIAREMLSNILTILFFDRNLLSKWFDDTWRLRVMTGESISFLTLTFAGTTAGSMILPVGGTFVGFMFGFAAATLVPRSVNNAITYSLKTLRAQISFGKLLTNETYLKEYSRRSKTELFKSTLSERRAIRESVVTGGAEQIHKALRILRSDEYGRAARRTSHERVEQAADRIRTLYALEFESIQSLKSFANDPALLTLLNQEAERVQTLNEFWQATLIELASRVGKGGDPLSASAAAEPDTDKLLRFFESLHLNAYLEQSLL